MTESYGPYQEFAALALQHLITLRSTLKPRDTTPVMQARHQMVLTLRDRATLLRTHPGSVVAPSRRNITTIGVARRPLWHVASTLASLPTPADGEGCPSDVLRLRPEDPPIVAAWRHAARAMTLGTAALHRAESKPWEDDKSAAWHLLGDLAMTTAALCSLDDRLGAQGLLPRLSGNARVGRQLSLLDVAGLADAWGRNAAADTISPTVGAQTAGNAAIRIVRHSADLPGALISLATALDGDPSMPGVTGAHTRAGLRALRAVAVGQAQLSLAYARGASTDGDDKIAARFRRRAHAYADLHRSCLGLRDHMPDRGERAILQQREITLLVRRNGRLDLASADAMPRALAQLDRAVAQRVLAFAHEGLVGATRQTQESVIPQPPFLAFDRHGDAVPATQRTRLAELIRTLPGAPMRSLGR